VGNVFPKVDFGEVTTSQQLDKMIVTKLLACAVYIDYHALASP